MTYGVTATGFVIKTLAIIKEEIETDFRAAFGDDVDLDSESPFGQIIGIFSEREKLVWEAMEDVYNSQYPDTGTGNSLDNVCALLGIARLAANKSTDSVLCFGTPGTVIPIGSIFSVVNQPDNRFISKSVGTIAAVQNYKQKFIFSSVPASGQWQIGPLGNPCALLAYNANNAAIKAALEALAPAIHEVTVTGDYTAGIEIEGTGIDAGIDFEDLATVTTLLKDGTGVDVTITQSNVQFGGENCLVACDAEYVGDNQAPVNSLTDIVTPISGLTSARNPYAAVRGRLRETDAELRIRRDASLQVSDAGTLEAIKAIVLTLAGVTACKGFENTGDVVDVDGRPPHSFEIVTEGGDDQLIADTIWAAKPAGIATFGSTTMTVVDSGGETQVINFSRPTPVDIYLDIVLTVTSDYPVDGDTQVLNAILAYGVALSMGDDVIVYPHLIASINDIAGIEDVVIDIGTTPAPSGDSNVVIAATEVSSWSSGNVVVTS